MSGQPKGEEAAEQKAPRWGQSGGQRGGQSLRRRITIAVGLFTTVAVIIFGTSVWVLVGRNLRAAVDTDLEATAELIQTISTDRVERETAEVQPDADQVFPFDRSAITGDGQPPLPVVQVLSPTGLRLGLSDVSQDVPVSEMAGQVAADLRDRHVESIEVDGRTIRMLTTPFSGGPGVGALQVGTDITNISDGLRRARAGMVVAGVLSGLGAAAMAWLFSRRLVAPVTAVADAADRLRTDRQLPDRLTGEGPDELGRLVASFNHVLDDLRDSRNRQRRLVADASHELRTPLTSLGLKIEFIQAEPDLDPDARQRLVTGAVADLRSLGDLVSELVELAAEGTTDEKPTLTDLGALVTVEAERFAATSGREVTVTTRPGLVETRPKQVTRALTNLLVNADKYSPHGLPIVVRQAGPRIEVRDLGPGIPIAERAKVFDRFHRGQGHQSIEGSGLGLAIVESMASANGGTTWIADPADGGAGTVVGFSAGPTAD